MSMLRANLMAIWGRAYVRIVGVNREPSWILFDVIFPMLGVASYAYIYKAMNTSREFMGFAILGGAMTAYWMNVIWSMASQFYWEKQNGNLELFFVAPTSRMAILLGMAFGGMVTSTTRAVAVILFGMLVFGVRFTFSSFPLAVLAFILTVVALYGLGMMLSSVFLMYGRDAWHMANLMQEPVYLISGLYFPVKALGFWAALAGSIIPLTLGLDAIRQLSFSTAPTGFLPVKWEIAGLSCLTVLLFFGASRSLAYMEKLAKREGRLTLKWQ